MVPLRFLYLAALWFAEHLGMHTDSIRIAPGLGKTALAGGARMKENFPQEDSERHHRAHRQQQKGTLQVGDGQLLGLSFLRLWEVMMVNDTPKN